MTAEAVARDTGQVMATHHFFPGREASVHPDRAGGGCLVQSPSPNGVNGTTGGSTSLDLAVSGFGAPLGPAPIAAWNAGKKFDGDACCRSTGSRGKKARRPAGRWNRLPMRDSRSVCTLSRKTPSNVCPNTPDHLGQPGGHPL
ncbi:MAG: hypothetical protein Ct9H300mP1_12890 [Planctomycetaceae bacterium]|nr:MAG: hypothetical protein Ct9H300mP1_12890 [Planctomycetaceae bacterium]